MFKQFYVNMLVERILEMWKSCFKEGFPYVKMYHSFLYCLILALIGVPQEAKKFFDNFFKDISFAQGTGCCISKQVWGGNF